MASGHHQDEGDHFLINADDDSDSSDDNEPLGIVGFRKPRHDAALFGTPDLSRLNISPSPSTNRYASLLLSMYSWLSQYPIAPCCKLDKVHFHNSMS